MLINLPFFKTMFKEQRNHLWKISSGIILYEGLLIWVYPAISKSPAVSEIVNAIPSTVKTVFGVSAKARTDTFEAFISGQFFARIWTMAMTFYGINTANALLAKLIDDGSLAFPLSAPVSRKQILTTQAIVLFANNILLILSTFAGIILGTHVVGIKINHLQYAKLSVLSLSFFSVIGSYAFLFSTLVDKEKSLAYAYALTSIFYGLDVAAGLSDKLAWTGNFSLFRLLRPQEVLENTVYTAEKVIGLSLISAILLAVAGRVFENKDLPL